MNVDLQVKIFLQVIVIRKHAGHERTLGGRPGGLISGWLC